MIINKITTGFVIQQYDTDLKTWISQEFVGGEVQYEDWDGEEIFKFDEPKTDLPFDMIQPV